MPLKTIWLLQVCLILLCSSPGLSAAEKSPPQQAVTKELAPPSKHWVYELPVATQSKTVLLTLRSTDSTGKLVTFPCEVLAICQPWGFRLHKPLAANGVLSFRGPVGDWSFHTCFCPPQGPVLSTTRRAKVTQDLTVNLQMPARAERLGWVDASGHDLVSRFRDRQFAPGQEKCYLGAGILPMLAPGLPSTLSGRDFPPGNQPLSIFAGPGEDCIVGFVAAPRAGEPGLAWFARRKAGGKSVVSFDDRKLATVVVKIDDNWPDMHLEVIGIDQEDVPVCLYVPILGAGRYEVRVRSGVVRIGLGTLHGRFAPAVHNLAPGSRVELAYGGPFRASPEVLGGDRNHLSVWFDVRDRVGNPLSGFMGKARLRLQREAGTLFDGPMNASGGRWEDIKRDWGTDWDKKPLSYVYDLDSELTGRITAQGQLEPWRAIEKGLSLVGQTAHFEVFARGDPPNGVRTCEAMESLLAALSAGIAGPVGPSQGDRFRIQFTSPHGIAWSSGNVIGLDIYAGRWFWPVGCGEAMGANFHEFGHSYSLVPPRKPPFWGDYEGQGFATWLAYQGIRWVYGDRAYQQVRMEQNSAILSAPEGEKIDGFMLVLDYVDQRFGAAVNREAYRLLYNGQGDLRGRIERDASLKTEQERLAVLHSKLVSQNLAWLYRRAHMPVSDETVRGALEQLKP